MSTFLKLTLLFFYGLLTSCGYHLQNSQHNELEPYGIRKIYVEPIENKTIKAGVENLIYNQLVKAIASQGGVKLVREKSDADASIKGSVTIASYNISAQGQPREDELTAGGVTSDFKVDVRRIVSATLYSANLSCSFTLEKNNKSLWSATFSQSKPFPGNNRFGVLGTTSALINDSEFDRALGDISERMMVEVREAMIARF